jgi:hypothetical protein
MATKNRYNSWEVGWTFAGKRKRKTFDSEEEALAFEAIPDARKESWVERKNLAKRADELRPYAEEYSRVSQALRALSGERPPTQEVSVGAPKSVPRTEQTDRVHQYIGRNPGVTRADIGRALEIHPSYIGLIVGSLIFAGKVEERASDGSRKLLYLPEDAPVRTGSLPSS